MKKTLIAIAIAALSSQASAQQIPSGNDNQTNVIGDSSVVEHTGDNRQKNAQSGNSLASGNDLSTDSASQSTVTGGNTTSGATGNRSDNANNSSVGNTTSGSNSGVGDTSSSSGGNKLGQQQGINRSGNSANDVSGSNSMERSGNSANENANAQGQSQGLNRSGNSSNDVAQGQANSTQTGVSVDAADRSHYSRETNVDARTWVIPSVVPPTPASVTGVGDIIHDVSSCGPLQSVVREPVQGHYFGLVSTSRFDVSYNDTLLPYFDQSGNEQLYKNVQGRYYGHQVISDTAILGTAAARNMALGGGGGSNANWGQAGGGSSSSVQTMVTHIQLRLCDAGGQRIELPVIRSVKQ